MYVVIYEAPTEVSRIVNAKNPFSKYFPLNIKIFLMYYEINFRNIAQF